MSLYLVEDKKGSGPAPVPPQAPDNTDARTHPIAKALALTVGAFALLTGGFALGTARGQDLLRAWMPSIAEEQPAPVVRQSELDDGYDGQLARRVAEASAQVADLGAPLDEVSAGAIDGLLSAAGDESATYLSPAEYERFRAASRSARADAASSSRSDASRSATHASQASDAAGTGAETLVADAATGVVHGVGVVRVSRLCDGALGSGAADAISDSVEALGSRGATSFVLDLRGVAGSDMGEAVRVSSLFLDGGTVARTHASGADDALQVQAGLTVTSAPLAVLVDETTYGTPEVVAGALQDHQRALIVGRVSAGGAAMQEVRELASGGALVLASAQVATPDDLVINGRGIAPDMTCAAGAKVSGAGELASSDVQLACAVACASLWQQGGSMALDGLTNAPGPQDAAFDEEPSDPTQLLVAAGLATDARQEAAASVPADSAQADAAAQAATGAQAQADVQPTEGGEAAADADAAQADPAADASDEQSDASPSEAA